MNLSEIRAKYPQYDSISDDVLVQKLHDKYYPKMDINEFSNRVGYGKQQPTQISNDELDYYKKQADDINKRAGIDTSGLDVAKNALKGVALGTVNAIDRLKNGGTFGFNDFYLDKLSKISGIESLSPKKRMEELEKNSDAIKYLDSGLEIVGGIPSGGSLFKGLSAGAKAIPYVGKALKYAVPTVNGAITGGLYSGFENDSLGSAGTGALTGGLVAGALDAGLRGAGKLFSAVEKVKNTPRGFENAVGTKEGARILNRAVRESDDIAERVYGKAPEALDNLNVRAMDKLDDAVKGGVDVKGRMAGAKKAYGDFIDENKANQVIDGGKVSDLGIKGLTENQQNWLNQAWTSGKRNTLEKAGSLGHLDEISKELNKMVQGSRLANPNGVGTVATPETVALQGLKDKVDDVIEKAGLQNIKAQYRQAKALEDSFNQGLNFNPNSVKTRNITFKTPDEQSAFAQGLVEKVKMNPESKNIAGKTRDLRGALRKALGEKADGVFKEMDNINKSYKNVEKVLGNAERKLSVPEPINGKVGLLREFVESPGSVVGGLADFARRWSTAKSAERAAKYLLDPTLKLGNSPYEAIRQYTPTIGGLGIGNLIRKGE